MCMSCSEQPARTIIDCHAHIYPDGIARRAADSIAAFYDMPVRLDGSVGALLESGAQAGVGRWLVHSVAVTPERVRAVNTFLGRAVAVQGGRFVGFGSLHPALADMAGELAALRRCGLVGVKLHPDFQRFLIDDASSVRMLRAIADAGLHTLIHAGDSRQPFSQPSRIARALDAVPGLRVICAHLGGWSVWQDAWPLLAGRPNLWVDTSSSLYALAPDEAAANIRRYGADRVLFGTDYPMWSPDDELARVDALPLTPREREDILHENFERFFGATGTLA